MTFTEEQIEQIEMLAGINYSVRKIAMYLDIDLKLLQKEFEDKESTFRYHFDRGRLVAQAEIDMKAVESAKGGNLTAMQQYEKVRTARHFENMRDQLIDGH